MEITNIEKKDLGAEGGTHLEKGYNPNQYKGNTSYKPVDELKSKLRDQGIDKDLSMMTSGEIKELFKEIE